MLLTEEEAKTKGCQEAIRAIANVHTAAGQGPIMYPSPDWSHGASTFHPKCIGSACMAWRWQGQGRGYCGKSGPVTFQYPTQVPSEENR